MAPGKMEKKRKAPGATSGAVPVPPSKKSRKSEDKSTKTSTESAISPGQKKAVETSENNGVISAKLLKVNGEAARKIKPRKRAADFLSDDESDDESDDGGAQISELKNSPVAEKSKSSKKKSKNEVNKDTSPAAPAPTAANANNGLKSRKENKAKDKKEKKSEAKTELAADSASDAADNVEEGESEDEGEDDQTVALIKGFESSGDEDISDDEGYEAGNAVPTIPDSKKTKKKLQKIAKDRDTPDEPGTVYVGRIPHGFYEEEMRAYFSQFGPITRLRLSRNRVTGRSKHYAFIEFASASVAKIVAKTMDNYLMFGHILKCKVIPQEQVHPKLWEGANRRFNKTPWNRVEQFRLEGGKTRDKWSKKVAAEEKKRASKAEKLKALGYEVKLPALKGVQEVPVREKTAKLKDGLDNTHDVTDTDKTNGVKAIDTMKAADAEKDTSGKSKKKAKKSKEAVKSDIKTGQVKDAEEDDTPKSEKKKRRTAETDVGDIVKKAKKVKAGDGGVASEKSSKKSRRESTGDEAKPEKVKKDKTKAKAKAKDKA